MPKGKSNSNQYLQAYMLFAAGLSRLEIWNELKSTYGDKTVTTRSIGSWLKEFRVLPESEIIQDSEFSWEKCDAYGIPWTESMHLIKIVRLFEGSYGRFPTGREAKWVWRVTQTNPNWNRAEIVLGAKYAERELMDGVTSEFVSFEDLNRDLLSGSF